MRENGEMVDASPPPRAPLGSSGFVPALGPQDIAVLVQTVNQQTLAHYQLATTLEVVGKAMGAEMRDGRSCDTTPKGESLNLGLIFILSVLSDTLPVRKWLHVVKSCDGLLFQKLER
jgi:hypothetical protein